MAFKGCQFTSKPKSFKARKLYAPMLCYVYSSEKDKGSLLGLLENDRLLLPGIGKK